MTGRPYKDHKPIETRNSVPFWSASKAHLYLFVAAAVVFAVAAYWLLCKRASLPFLAALTIEAFEIEEMAAA